MQGNAGPQGPTGKDGKSAYQIALGRGYIGTEAEWLNSLKGATGPAGSAGLAATISVESSARIPFDDNPYVENVGTPQAAILRFGIPAGMPGAQGSAGKSAYQVALDGGYVGTETEWLASLKGEPGPAGPGFPGVYAYVYGKKPQEVEHGADVVFNQPPIPSSLPAGITFNAPSTLLISSPGVYEVAYYVSGPQVPFALTLHGEELVGTRCPYGGYSAFHYWQSLVVVEAAVTPAPLTLRNVDSDVPASIGYNFSDMENTANVSLLIKKIG